MPSDSEPGITFMSIKAKGKFDTPSLTWTMDDFEREYEKMEAFTNEMMQLLVH
jgi:hypothetical protein